MSGLMQIDPVAMDSAASRCDALASRLEECRLEAIAINDSLQDCYKGASAQAFYDFITQTAAPILYDTADMCTQTARGIRHTLDQFTQADTTLAGVFNAQ
ncbi:MAG: WXG100 family type VII secretion target [Promicromonosporaceae bacterium]|nr:WXG100 family type VII secretion target [Promicromonosporaceae bacterium]